jgi:hypothetical protein
MKKAKGLFAGIGDTEARDDSDDDKKKKKKKKKDKGSDEETKAIEADPSKAQPSGNLMDLLDFDQPSTTQNTTVGSLLDGNSGGMI